MEVWKNHGIWMISRSSEVMIIIKCQQKWKLEWYHNKNDIKHVSHGICGIHIYHEKKSWESYGILKVQKKYEQLTKCIVSVW